MASYPASTNIRVIVLERKCEKGIFMPYITIKQVPIYYQISFDDILDGKADFLRKPVLNETNTKTYFKKTFKREFLAQYDFEKMIALLKEFNNEYEDLFEVDRKTLYETFYIPKRSGGLREINAPLPELMEALRKLKRILETQMPASYHTSAFAYIKGRSTIDCVKRHQQNGSRWFAKFDFSDFFGSTTEEFVLSMFSQIFPFSEIVVREDGLEVLKRALSLCFLNGGLPQGTPISPFITNVMMIPIDHYLYNNFREMNGHFVYTRYADDILVSSKTDFECGEIQNYIIETLKVFSAPFSLKKQKTRYGSSAGRNWNLGVMLNKDNEITIGHQKKKTFKAMCFNYVNDKKNGVNWDIHDVQVFQGLISYYRMIEKNYINYVIEQINKKFGTNIEALIKIDLHV